MNHQVNNFDDSEWTLVFRLFNLRCFAVVPAINAIGDGDDSRYNIPINSSIGCFSI